MMDERSKRLRRLVVRGLEGGNRGHVGSSMSLIEIMRVLYDDVAGSDDRIILSKGHGCLAQYALLVDKGVIPHEELDRFCRYDGLLGGHPTRGVPGIQATTGALGHGLAIGVGLALGGDPSRRVFVVLGDGELGEGSVWEAALHAAKHHLSNLIAIVDVNMMQSAGPTAEISAFTRLGHKFHCFGWHTLWVDGHDVTALAETLKLRRAEHSPTMVLASTIKGKGIPFAENNLVWHHKNSFTVDEITAMKEALK